MVALNFDQVVCDAVVMENISISENCEMRLMVSLIVDGQRCEDDIPDDIIVFSCTVQEHFLNLADVFYSD